MQWRRFSQSVSAKIILAVVVGLMIEGVLIMLLFNYNLRDLSGELIEGYETRAVNNEREKLANYVQLAYEVVQSYYQRSTDIEALKREEYGKLKRVVDAVYNQAKSFHDKNKDFLPKEELESGIKALAAAARFDNGNYIWINDMHPNMVMHPIKPALDGKDLSGFKDQQGTYLFNEMVKVCQGGGEGVVSYLWPKPGEQEAKLKISYVRLLPELGWIFGSGAWIEDITAAMQAEALDQIARMRLGKDGYFWINDMHPAMVMHPIKPSLDGKDLSNFKDTKGTRLFKEMVKVCDENGQGFVKYWWPKPGKKGDFPKLSYVKLFEPWGWVIGMGVYIDSIDEAVVAQRTFIADGIGGVLAQTVLIGGAVVLVMLAILILIIRQGLYLPMSRLVGYSSHVSRGELSYEPKGGFKGEMEELKNALQAMVSSLKEKIAEADEFSSTCKAEADKAREATSQAEAAKAAAEDARRQGMLEAAERLEDLVASLSSASEQLSSQMEQINQGAQLQLQRTDETATSMEEMNATVIEVARNASQAAEDASQAKGTAQDGADIVRNTVSTINRVNELTHVLKRNMDELGEQAQAIGRIMNVINDIADQTNLLALNAAIEAARAGEAGRGFAVVADEVRKLAEKTMQATKEVGEAISAIQNGTQKNVEDVDRAAKEVEGATALANDSGHALEKIVNLSEATSDQVRSIAAASEQQSTASEEISRAVEDISRISSETGQGMRHAGQAIQDLARLAGELKDMIDRFRHQ